MESQQGGRSLAEQQGETVSCLLQTLGRLSKTLPVSAASVGRDGTAKGRSASSTGLFGSNSSSSALSIPELCVPHQLPSISSCSVDSIMRSLVGGDPATHRGTDFETYPQLIPPMQDLAFSHAPYVFVGDTVVPALGRSPTAALLPSYFGAPLPSPYTSDPTALASILSMLERSQAVVPESLPCDVPVGSVAGDRFLDKARDGLLRSERDGSSPSFSPKDSKPTKASEKCPALASDPEDVDKDTSATGAVDVGTHQRQHLLTTSLGPGAYFRARKRRPYRHESFPEKLHRMLVEAEQNGKGDVVCFTPSGLAFEIHRVDEFLSDVIPEFFRHRSISSFRRQLSMYGFKRVRDSGPDHGAYQHELFRRDQPLLCRQMKRVTELELVLPDDANANATNRN